jgi:hypothetical protein
MAPATLGPRDELVVLAWRAIMESTDITITMSCMRS